MNFQNAVATCFRKYTVFTGVASRSEYWYFFLFYAIVEFLSAYLGAIRLVIWAATVIPLAAVGVRRLHDAGKSGWWLLLPIVNLVLLTLPPLEVGNRYRTDVA